jgi:Protein of unknown function (DUF3347).
MKKMFSLIAFFAATFVQKSAAQDSTQQQQLSQLLTQYYNIKDALVAGNGNLASVKADEFIKTANSIDYKLISEGNINALLKDATPISETKDVKIQREHFANLSNNMIALAKVAKLGTVPIYQQYCPMKKTNWLSNNRAIKNPYYGNAMLTCGQVVETINQ